MSFGQTPGNLVQIRAGWSGTTVTPEDRKGLLYLRQEDDLMHLCWKDRKTNAVEDDLIIFPHDAQLHKVTQSNGRVYVLKFQSSSQRLFFWLQEPKDDKDEETITKINSYINNPPGTENAELMNFLQSSMGGSGSASGPSTAQLEQLRTILHNINVSDAPPSPAIADLSSVLTVETVGPALNNPEISAALFPNIPYKADRTPDEIRTIMETADFQQAAQTLATGLETGELGPLLESLGVDSNSNLSGVQALLQALQAHIQRHQSGSGDRMQED
ncbi:adhesion regulating molecule 1 [Rhizophlyctis rosea]|uniref:Adhesion regulating molecule 1 n=1 Tax=Rhizophlyctis rosea TaxID=64517 RepID=A0AAD5SCJ5_9FUNG|nr:adhesion regulating molecule 1 [Rhizophlyctis rosea]